MKSYDEICNSNRHEDWDKFMAIQTTLIMAKSIADSTHTISDDAFKCAANLGFKMNGPIDINEIQKVAVEIFNKYSD